MPYGTIVADPPWDYLPTSRHKKLSGYSDVEYKPLTTTALCELPIADLGSDESVLFLWTTWPFISDAMKVIDAWGFRYVTGFPWVKVDGRDNLAYGVGYWFRGCTEPVLVGKRKRAYRSNLCGILGTVNLEEGALVGRTLGHSRKPEYIHDLVERGGFPKPYLELFGRRAREGWTVVGNEAPDTPGEDIRDSVARLAKDELDGPPAYV